MTKEKKIGQEKSQKKDQKKEKKPENSKPEPGKKKRMNKKVVVVVAVIVIIIVLIIGLWGLQDNRTDYPTVSKILEGRNKYLNKEVEFRGTVKIGGYDPFNKTFILTDDENDLRVNYTGVLPSNFEENKDVVVKGILHEYNELVVVANADDVTVGCASKY